MADDSLAYRAGLHLGELSVKANYGSSAPGRQPANRLREGPAPEAMLIEAGGTDWNPYIHISAGFMKLLDHPTLTWGFKAEPDPGTAGRAILYPRGKVLGGIRRGSKNSRSKWRSEPRRSTHSAAVGGAGLGPRSGEKTHHPQRRGAEPDRTAFKDAIASATITPNCDRPVCNPPMSAPTLTCTSSATAIFSLRVLI